MTKRIRELCALLPACKTLADVGCDHGYLAQYALKEGLCGRVYITDISEKSLGKAVRLMQSEIAAGRCVPVCTDGMQGLPPVEGAVIAGLGGEEIISILARDGIPPKFLLQPMKNSEKVRAFLLEHGCRIVRDYTFEDGKFYDVITGENCGGDSYTQAELAFGRENLIKRPPAFLKKVRVEIDKLRDRLTAPEMGEEAKARLQEKLTILENIDEL